MKVPLLVTPTNDGLNVHYNRRYEKIKFPFNPFILMERSALDVPGAAVEKWTKVPENEEREYQRLNFKCMDDLVDFRRNHIEIEKYMYYNSYLEQLLIVEPNFIQQYAHTEPVRVMYWDIETRTDGDGIFPQACDKPIICIGYSIWEYNPDGSKVRKTQKIIDYFEETDVEDKTILEEFVKDIGLQDPDVLAGFNSEEFDFPYLYERCKIQKVDMKAVSRGGRNEPWITKDGKIFIAGRIHYDMFKKVMKDQSLFGMKSRNLKETARHYKAPLNKDQDVELKGDIGNTMNVWKNHHTRLIQYQEADVIRTEHVGHVYIRNDIVLAERMQVPLNNTMNTYSSFIPKLFVGRNMWNRKLINTETNFSKYNGETGSVNRFVNKDGKELKYEGAVVGLYKAGFFQMTYKLDFSSMYPSSICTWNLGPDTTTFVEIKEYTGKYRFHQSGKYNWYRVPDANFGCDIVIKVRNDVEGFLSSGIKMLWKERAEVKSRMKELSPDSDEYNVLNSQQMAIKVILNSIYGFMGLNSTIYGDMMSALMVTAMCRWSTVKVIQKYENELVELDTDGLALDAEVSEEETNKWLDEMITSTFKVPENFMQMELETVGKAYFCKMKNYVVEKDGHVEIHGSSLKSSRVCNVIDRARDLAIECRLFNNKQEDEVIREAYDFSKCKIEDFEYRLRLSKDTRSYDDPTGQAVFLAKQVEKKTGQRPREGTQMQYVVTSTQLTDPTFRPFYNKKGKGYNYTYVGYADDVKDINQTYYSEQIDKMLERFDIKRCRQMDLFGEQDTRKFDTVPKEI